MATVAEGDRRRIYLAPTPEHEKAADVPVPQDAPDTELPEAALGFRVQGYGMSRHADLFTPRQLTALTTLSDLVHEARAKILVDSVATGLSDDGGPFETIGEGTSAYADGVVLGLGLALSRTADLNNSLVTWSSSRDQARNLFSMQTISMAWDYVEVSPFSRSAGDLLISVYTAERALRSLPARGASAVAQLDATTRDYGGLVVSTDPPYYDNVGYADLSDFFYVWLRRSVRSAFPILTDTLLTPKADELVADPFRRGGDSEAADFFELGFSRIFQQIRLASRRDLPTAVFYAFKQTETGFDAETVSTGWEVLLEGMVKSGWQVTATWPVRTERSGRARDIGSNALASSVVLALRPRSVTAAAINRRSFLAEMRSELPVALLELQQGSIAPVDLAQAAIGPGMRVFSRSARVMEADGSDMTVRTALALINQVLDEVLAKQEGDFDSDTRFCLKWFQQYAFAEADSGEADVLARATNTSVGGLERGGVFKAVAGRARLLGPADQRVGSHPSSGKGSRPWRPDRSGSPHVCRRATCRSGYRQGTRLPALQHLRTQGLGSARSAVQRAGHILE
jgi:putative DNA methylase